MDEIPANDDPPSPGRLTPVPGRPELAALYLRVAEALDRTAQLAEQHAQHEHEKGRPLAAARELERAQRARAAALRGHRIASRLGLKACSRS